VIVPETGLARIPVKLCDQRKTNQWILETSREIDPQNAEAVVVLIGLNTDTPTVILSESAFQPKTFNVLRDWFFETRTRSAILRHDYPTSQMKKSSETSSSWQHSTMNWLGSI
jgi:hypothetical protein